MVSLTKSMPLYIASHHFVAVRFLSVSFLPVTPPPYNSKFSSNHKSLILLSEIDQQGIISQKKCNLNLYNCIVSKKTKKFNCMVSDLQLTIAWLGIIKLAKCDQGFSLRLGVKIWGLWLYDHF